MSDRTIGIIALVVATAALYYGWQAGRQNKEIIAHAKEIKDSVTKT